MRVTTAIAVTLLAVTPASAQNQYPYGLDPYNPSDAALLRNYGATLVAQTPLLELRKLDPYNPHHAALLRQLGGAMPLWGMWYPPFLSAPTFAPLTPFQRTQAVLPTGPSVVVIIVPSTNSLTPPRQLQDRQRELDQLDRPEGQPAQPKRPGFRVVRREGSSGPTLFLIQEDGTQITSGIALVDHLGPHLADEGER